MAINETIPEREEAMVIQGEALVGLLHQFIHGSAIEQVPTDGGPLSTLRKLLNDVLLEALGSYTSTYATVALGLAATSEGGFFGVVSGNVSEDRILYWKSGGVAVDTGKRSVSAAGLSDLRERFRDGRPTAFFKLGDGFGYNRWLAYDDGSFGTAEASIGPDGINLSAFDLIDDPNNVMAVRDEYGYYSLRVRSGNNSIAQLPGFQGLSGLARALENSSVEQTGKLFAMRDAHGYYALSLTQDSFSAKGKPPVVASSVSDAALAAQARRIDDVFSRGELRKLQVAAHRGFGAQAPENTMLAFSMALTRGADVLETDVQFSSDGVAYLFHDLEVSTLTDGAGNFSALTSAQIDALRFKQLVGTALEDCVRIPKLSSFLQFIRDESAHTFLELKGLPSIEHVDQVVQMIREAHLEQLVTVISFTYAYLQRVRALSSTMRVGYLVSADNYEYKVDNAAALAPADISPDVPSVLANPGIVEYARSKGVDVTVWTLASLATARRLQRLGVNRLTADVTLMRG